MLLVLSSFLVLFLLLASGGLLLFYRGAMYQRIARVVAPAERIAVVLHADPQAGFSFRGFVEWMERILPKSQAEISVVRQRLTRAGYRSDSALRFFYGAKVCLPFVLCLVAMGTSLGGDSAIFLYAILLGLGFLAPDFWLGRRITLRQKRIRLGLPDMLDLLVICIEAGLSMDQATARTAEELRLAHPAIGDELGIVGLEQRAGRARSDAWRQFADRTAVDSVRNLVSVLVQSEKLGTSVAKTLRIHADTLRTQRRQAVEEQAAKTTIKLVFPLVLFIFPSLFLVTLGPALIIMSESFKQYLSQ
jgi:tight adherence protein C